MGITHTPEPVPTLTHCTYPCPYATPYPCQTPVRHPVCRARAVSCIIPIYGHMTPVRHPVCTPDPTTNPNFNPIANPNWVLQ